MIGYIVIPKPGVVFHSGNCSYTHAICVSEKPFAMVSENADMLWSKTISRANVQPLCLADRLIVMKALARWAIYENQLKN